MEVNIQEAARIRGVSERRIDQQAKEGGWGIQKISRGRYFLDERGIDGNIPGGLILKTSKERLAYEKKLRSDFDDTEEKINDSEIMQALDMVGYSLFRDSWEEFKKIDMIRDFQKGELGRNKPKNLLQEKEGN